LLLFAEIEKGSQIGKELQLLNINVNTFTKPGLFRYIGHLGFQPSTTIGRWQSIGCLRSPWYEGWSHHRRYSKRLCHLLMWRVTLSIQLKKTGAKALKTKIIQRQKHNILGDVTGLPHFELLIHIHLSLTQETPVLVR